MSESDNMCNTCAADHHQRCCRRLRSGDPCECECNKVADIGRSSEEAG